MTINATTPEEVLVRFRQAWDAGDADAYSQLFTQDATYVIFMGELQVGREQIRETHHDVFTKWQKGTKLIVKAIETRQLDNDTVVLLTVGGIGTKTIDYDKFQTFVLVRRDGGWLISAFHNTEMSKRLKKQYAA
ncbi:MAG: SgcJ/EcaC family oxidoreductase [Leifsonia sp.]